LIESIEVVEIFKDETFVLDDKFDESKGDDDEEEDFDPRLLVWQQKKYTINYGSKTIVFNKLNCLIKKNCNRNQKKGLSQNASKIPFLSQGEVKVRESFIGLLAILQKTLPFFLA